MMFNSFYDQAHFHCAKNEQLLAEVEHNIETETHIETLYITQNQSQKLFYFHSLN